MSRKSSFLLFSSVATPKQFLEQLIGCSVEVASLALAFWMKPPFGYNSHHLILNLTALLQHGLYLPTPVQHPDCSCSPPLPRSTPLTAHFCSNECHRVNGAVRCQTMRARSCLVFLCTHMILRKSEAGVADMCLSAAHSPWSILHLPLGIGGGVGGITGNKTPSCNTLWQHPNVSWCWWFIYARRWKQTLKKKRRRKSHFGIEFNRTLQAGLVLITWWEQYKGTPVTVTTEIAATVQLSIRAVQIKVISPSRGAFDWTGGRLHREERNSEMPGAF